MYLKFVLKYKKARNEIQILQNIYNYKNLCEIRMYMCVKNPKQDLSYYSFHIYWFQQHLQNPGFFFNKKFSLVMSLIKCTMTMSIISAASFMPILHLYVLPIYNKRIQKINTQEWHRERLHVKAD